MIISAILGIACAFISAFSFVNWGKVNDSKTVSIFSLIFSLVFLFTSGFVCSKGESDMMNDNINKYEAVKILHVEFTPGKEIFITVQKNNGTINLIYMDKVNFGDISVNEFAKRVDDKLVPFK